MQTTVKFIFTLPQASTEISIGGEVYTVDRESNSVQIPLEKAERLVLGKIGNIFSIKTNEQLDTVVVGVTNPASASEPPTDNELLAQLLKKSVQELQGVAAESELPEEEWIKLTKPNLVKYLVDKASKVSE